MHTRGNGLSLLLLLVCSTAQGQVQLTQANSAPVVGDAYIRQYGSVPDVTPLPGTPPLYDHSAGTPTGAPDTVTFTAPTDGAWCSGWIPGADVELCDGWAGPDGNGRYYIPSPTGLVLMGAFDDAAYLFADQKLDMPYPCEAGTTWSDTYAGADQWGTDRQILGTIDGVAVTECDVLTPDGLHTGALRVETTTLQDRHENGAFFSHMEHEVIAYHVPGIHVPVLVIHDATYSDVQGLNFSLSSAFWYQGAISTGIQAAVQANAEEGLFLSWDHATKAFLVSGSTDGVIDYRIVDAVGRCVESGQASGPFARIPVGPHARGLLLCQVSDPRSRAALLRVVVP